MRKAFAAAVGLSIGATSALAGGIERSTQSVAILFENGRYGELTFSLASPDVSGALGPSSSGDMAETYMGYSLGYKQALGENLDLAIILDQPVGADVNYPTGTGYPFAGSTAVVRSTALTGLIRYKMPSNISIIAGARVQNVTGDVAIPVYAYTMTADGDTKYGYVLGVSWEKPEIAARVALTYNSAMTHTMDTAEATPLGPVSTPFETTIPQSVNLEFQTGIAADTLLFGSVRWVNWSAFDITPPGFFALTGGSLSSYDADVYTYTLGVGRRFSDNWSAAVTAGYEDHKGDPVGNLGPTDGYASLGVGATYTQGNMKITGGLRHVVIGDAVTSTIGGLFEDNHAIGGGVRIGISF